MESSLCRLPCNQMIGFPGSTADLFSCVCLIQCLTLPWVHQGLTSLRLDMLTQSFVHSHSCPANNCTELPFNWNYQPLRSARKSAAWGCCCWAEACLWVSRQLCLRWPVAAPCVWVCMCVSCSGAVMNAPSAPLLGKTGLISALQRASLCRDRFLVLWHVSAKNAAVGNAPLDLLFCHLNVFCHLAFTSLCESHESFLPLAREVIRDLLPKTSHAVPSASSSCPSLWLF